MVWKQNSVKLMCFVQQGLIYAILKGIRNSDNTGLTSSETVLFVLNIEHYWQLHRSSFVMHFWNARKQPQTMSIKNSHHVTKEAGLKSTLGRIRVRLGHHQPIESTWFPNIAKTRVNYYNEADICLQRSSHELKFEKFVWKGKSSLHSIEIIFGSMNASKG